MNRVPLMGRSIIWLEFDTAPELFLCLRPVPIIIHENMRQRCVGFGQCVIQCQRFYCRFLCPWHCFVWGGKIVKRQSSVAIRQSDIAKSEMRVALDRLLELSDSLFYSVRSALVPKIATPQIEAVRLS